MAPRSKRRKLTFESVSTLPRESAHDFQHDPLAKPKQQLRLLRFLPWQREDDPLQLALSPWYVGHTPDYRAVSYTWGPAESQEVMVNGMPYHVQTNCYYALCQVRARDPEGYVWMDAICINQRDNDEKQDQVATMKDIFVGASLVLVCVGPHENESEKVVAIAMEMENAVEAAAMEEAKDVYQLSHVILGPWYHKHWTRCIEALQKEETIRLRDALMSFMDRPYWTRLWILQEVAAADRRLQVLCGSSTISWLGVYQLLELREMGNFPSAPSILGDHVQEWYRYRKKWIADLWSDRRLATLDIEGALDLARDRLCNDPRDRVYGLLGLIDWSWSDAPLLPDYGKTALQLAIDVLERIGNLRAAMKTLVPLEVFSGNEAMRQLRQRSQQGPRTCTDRKLLLERAEFTGVQLRTSKREDRLPDTGISLITPGDKLDRDQILGSIKGMLEDHYQSHPESEPKPLAVGGQVVGFAGHETQVDDVLAYPNIFRHNEQIFLVLRHRSENDFYVGQGFLVGRHTWKSSAEFTHWKDKEDFLSLSVHMTAEDAVLFVGQDLTIDEDGTESYDLEARFERLSVNPIGQHRGAAFFGN